MAEAKPPKSLAEVSAENARALLSPTTWIHRRVESMTFTEQLMVRRRISVDFTIDPVFTAYLGDPEQGNTCTYFLPVALLRKWPPLMKLDLRTQNDEPIPLLTTSKNREVDAAVLKGVAKLYIKIEALLDTIDDDLTQIALASPIVATEAAARLRDALTAHGREIGGGDAVAFARDAADPLLNFATGLVANSMLWVRIDGLRGERRIVKIAFEDPVRQAQNPRRRFFASFSWQAIAAEYEIPHIGNSGIYHCQVDPPPQLQMVSAKLILDDPPVFAQASPSDQEAPLEDDSPSLPRVVAQSLKYAAQLRYRELFGEPSLDDPAKREPDSGVGYSRVSRGRAHLYVSGARKGFGIASVRMAVASRALATASLISSTMIAILLTTLVALAEAATEHVGETVTVLLLVPGLLGFLARPQEHPIVARYLAGLRALTLASAATSLLAAITLLGTRSPDAGSVRPTWAVLALVAWLIVLLLLPSWLLPAAPFQNEEELEASA